MGEGFDGETGQKGNGFSTGRDGIGRYGRDGKHQREKGSRRNGTARMNGSLKLSIGWDSMTVTS